MVVEVFSRFSFYTCGHRSRGTPEFSDLTILGIQCMSVLWFNTEALSYLVLCPDATCASDSKIRLMLSFMQVEAHVFIQVLIVSPGGVLRGGRC